ncbi:MAG: pyridinium-3,5-biscarboxylic acid mononucleotide synthase [Candidatus Sumerlaeota bacterium]|nr:pyridinium-3,5-biscarboxylic acid mononucleotide synthase [Candidatus Sumerlaeota bacterium]
MTKPPDASPAGGALHTDLAALMRQVAEGGLDPAAAAQRAHGMLVRDLGFAQVDTHRQVRRGRPEAVFCQGKTPEQIITIARSMRDAGQNVLMTRLGHDCFEQVAKALEGPDLRRHPLARMLYLEVSPTPRKTGRVGIVCAGTTDIPVAEEAAVTAEALGSPVDRLWDAGVAGIHRILRQQEKLAGFRVLVVVAGMEGALPSVVAGLVKAPVIAVPTSVGYGASFGGLAALLGMLNSCAPGIGVVNIDNGYGAGYLADAMNELGEVDAGCP